MEFLTPLIFFVIGLFASYLVIKYAVTHALLSHYKTVRLFESTGEWLPGPHDAKEPRQL